MYVHAHKIHRDQLIEKKNVFLRSLCIVLWQKISQTDLGFHQ